MAGPRVREFEETEINKMLKTGMVVPSEMKWAALMVFAPNKDGSCHFCVG